VKPTTVLTPYREQVAVDLGNHRWRKQLLPIGDIDYRGRKLSFTKDYLTELARSFQEKAFDLVPFQLAPHGNEHTNDPERTRGTIESVEVADDGLYLVLSATDEGDRVIRENPKLGVSARIYENYKRSDGKKWTAALQHVLGTLDPHITGMKPWQEVAALANAAQGRVLDLTGATFDEEEGGEQVAFTDEDKATFVELLKKVRDGGSNLSDEDLDALVDEAVGDDADEGELTDEELDQLIADAEAEEAAEGEGGDNEEEGAEPVNASRSNGHNPALDLANARLEEQAIELARVSAALNAQAYTNEKNMFAQLGIPPLVVELARPLLEGEGHVIELAGGDSVDAGAVMRRVFTELGKTIKILDLGQVLGNGDLPDEEREEIEQEEKDRADFVAGERARMGL
jgi:hypothetical protein